MRTDEEIIARAADVKDGGHDFLGVECSDLITRLPFEKARPFMDESITAEEWPQYFISRERDDLINEMRVYMPFAWEKANGFRGISAARSLSHFRAWVWLAGDDLGEFNNYTAYGKDHLVRICNHYGFENLDDGVRKNSEDE